MTYFALRPIRIYLVYLEFYFSEYLVRTQDKSGIPGNMTQDKPGIPESTTQDKR